MLVTLQNLSIAQTTCTSRKKRFSDTNLWNRNSIGAGNADAVSPRAQPVTESSWGRLSMWSYNYEGDWPRHWRALWPHGAHRQGAGPLRVQEKCCILKNFARVSGVCFLLVDPLQVESPTQIICCTSDLRWHTWSLRTRPQKSVFLAIFSGIAKPKSPTSLNNIQ